MVGLVGAGATPAERMAWLARAHSAGEDGGGCEEDGENEDDEEEAVCNGRIRLQGDGEIELGKRETFARIENRDVGEKGGGGEREHAKSTSFREKIGYRASYAFKTGCTGTSNS